MGAVDQANPLKSPVNCPLCGRPTRFSHVQQVPHNPRDSGWKTLFFRCERHGWVVFPAVGGIHVLGPNEPNPSLPDVVYLTREGCVNTATMRTRFDEALSALGWSQDYQVIDADALPGTDARRGYWTPTILYQNVDLFGMPSVQHETPT
jgi:hypothetical protein